MIYVVNLVLVCVYALILEMTGIKRKNKDFIFLFLCTVQFTLIIGTRSISTGVDTLVYYRFFQRINQQKSINFFMNNGFEPLYVLLCRIIGRLGLGFVWVNIVVAFLTSLFLVMAVNKLSSNKFFSIYLFIAFYLFNQMTNQYRQILAATIVLYALSKLIDDKKKQFIFWVIIAAGFHISALAVMPVVFLVNIPINKKTILAYLAVAIASVGLLNIIYYLASLTKYADYIGSMYDSEGVISTILNLVVRSVLLLFCLFFYENIKDGDRKINIYYHFALICTVVQFITTRSALLGRISTYFFAGYIFLIPEILTRGFKKRSNKMILYVSLFLIFLLWYYVYYNTRIGNEYSNYLFRM